MQRDGCSLAHRNPEMVVHAHWVQYRRHIRFVNEEHSYHHYFLFFDFTTILTFPYFYAALCTNVYLNFLHNLSHVENLNMKSVDHPNGRYIFIHYIPFLQCLGRSAYSKQSLTINSFPTRPGGHFIPERSKFCPFCTWGKRERGIRVQVGSNHRLEILWKYEPIRDPAFDFRHHSVTTIRRRTSTQERDSCNPWA